MLLYLDNCCFNRPFDDQTQLKIYLETQAKLDIQRKILNNDFSLVWSYILEFENFQNPFKMRKESIIKWKSVASVHIVENKEIIKNAENFQLKGIKAKDSLHIACAIFAKAKYFLTTDKKLLQIASSAIKICSPIDFVVALEGEI